MGGTNFVLYTPPDHPKTFTYPVVGDKSFMVMGAEMIYPIRDSGDQRSIAGVVGSLDPDLTRYACRGLVQEPDTQKKDVILDLKSAVKDLVLVYSERNNEFPESILFYRNEVSQDKFSALVSYEFNAIKRACAELGASVDEDYNPKIASITVQKRHDIGIYPFCYHSRQAQNLLNNLHRFSSIVSVSS
eukprot:g7291.t1